MAETGRREYLPVDDVSFEQGVNDPRISRVSRADLSQVQTTSEPLFVSSSTNITAAPLARLCQASHLLSLVLKHINDRDSSADDRLEEARQLSRAILALCSFMNSEVGPSATQIFVPKAVCLRLVTETSTRLSNYVLALSLPYTNMRRPSSKVLLPSLLNSN